MEAAVLSILEKKPNENSYFGLRFGFATTINNHLRLRINLICYNHSESDLFLYTKNLSNERLNPFFCTKSLFEFVLLCCEFTKVIS